MLVHIKEIIPKAEKGGYAIPAFNTFNLEVTLAIVRGAVAQNSPVIIQVSEKTIEYAGLKPITHIVETIAKNEAVNVPVALHLDHGKSFRSVAECIHAGFSSIHIDASELPLDENTILTKQVVDYAHKNSVWAQGELGTILGKKEILDEKISENLEKFMTNPDQAQEYVKKTKVDTFAPSVGAMHGLFVGKEKINQEILKQIKHQINIPIVLHGASGVSDEDIRQAISNGVVIINIDTRIRETFSNTLRETLMTHQQEMDPRKILTPTIDAIQKVIEEKIILFGSKGTA
ncbi:MAG: class II fructose-bisphosphate aldolase [Patescibacteria group bacterium]